MKNQISFLNVGIILIIIGLSFAIYFSYSYNVQKNQQEEQFKIFLQNLQNLAISMENSYGNYYVQINVPNNVILYSNNNYLIIDYNNVNYTINFYQQVILLNNNDQPVSFLLDPGNIYIAKDNNIIYITSSSEIAENVTYNQ
ncbi:hypothetical protein YN1_4400 [Nanoarchaeota archaeon]